MKPARNILSIKERGKAILDLNRKEKVVILLAVSIFGEKVVFLPVRELCGDENLTGSFAYLNTSCIRTVQF